MPESFSEIGINPELINGLKAEDIVSPTPIQKIAIPEILLGKNVIFTAKTGSGKTFSYLLPIFQLTEKSIRGSQFIILAPTYELAAQIYNEALKLSVSSGLNIPCALIIGGAGILRQVEKLKEKPSIIIGSPGRILELIKKRKIQSHLVKAIVLDEADRLLSDINLDIVEAVIKTTLKERKLIMCSASFSEEAKRIALGLTPDAVFLSPEDETSLPEAISHFYILSERREKIITLKKILTGEKPSRAMVFINNPENIEVITEKLIYHGFKAAGLYGKADKLERQNAINAFKDKRINILVSSDLGARGLNVPAITHIINLDIPENPEQYLHRAGRTGRCGKAGIVISIVTAYERKWLNKYKNTFGIDILQKEMYRGELINPKNQK